MNKKTVALTSEQYTEIIRTMKQGFTGMKPNHRIAAADLLFPITARAVQKQLALVCDYLGIHGIGTHSFRKFYATEIYKANGYNIALVQHLLQHSNAAVTQRYIGIQQKEVEAAIENHLRLDV